MSSDSDDYEGSTDVTKVLSTGFSNFWNSYRPKDDTDSDDSLFEASKPPPKKDSDKPLPEPIPIDAPSTSTQGITNEPDEPTIPQTGYDLRNRRQKRKSPLKTPARKPPPVRKRTRKTKSTIPELFNNPANKKRKKSPTSPPAPHLIHDISTDDDGKLEEPNPLVCITVIWQSVETKIFRLRKFSNFTIIFNYFVKEKSAHPKLLLFSIDDKVIDIKGQTFVTLRMTDETILEAGLLPDTYLEKENLPVKSQQNGLEFKVQYNNKETFKFHLLPKDKLEVLFAYILRDTGKDLGSFKILFDGSTVKQSDTVESLELEEYDQFDVVFT